MVSYILGPKWFYGISTVFELISILVSLLIFYYSYRVYKYTSQKEYLYFSSSFLMIAAAFIVKILSSISIYTKELKKITIGFITVTAYSIEPVKWIQHYGFMINRFLILLAFLVLLAMAYKIKDKKIIFLLAYFMFLSSGYSQTSFFVFHTTLTLMLAILTHFYIKNYLKKKKLNAKLVAISFSIIFLSQIPLIFPFIFSRFSNYFYVISETTQLMGYLFLLFTFIMLWKKK